LQIYHIQSLHARRNATKNFQEKFLHQAILPDALSANLRLLKSVPDRFLTTRAKAPMGALTSHWLVPWANARRASPVRTAAIMNGKPQKKDWGWTGPLNH